MLKIHRSTWLTAVKGGSTNVLFLILGMWTNKYYFLCQIIQITQHILLILTILNNYKLCILCVCTVYLISLLFQCCTCLTNAQNTYYYLAVSTLWRLPYQDNMSSTSASLFRYYANILITHRAFWVSWVFKMTYRWWIAACSVEPHSIVP